MGITGKAFRGFALLVSLVGLRAQSPETPLKIEVHRSCHGVRCQKLKIEVHIYDYSGVLADVLARAERETARIFGRSGVEMEWRNCGGTEDEVVQNLICERPGSPARLTLRLLSNAGAQKLGRGSNAYGLALLPKNGGFGEDAYVFAGRARELAADDESQSVVLGHLIAHELGHLLLGETDHSVSGIMHVPWQAKELERIKQGQMCFFPEQEERIRAQVVARVAESGSKITVLMYNYAAASLEVLAQTEAEAASIHRCAGIGILWGKLSSNAERG